MVMRWRTGRDPWWDDGTGARKDRTRRRLVGATAFALAVIACGVTTAAWLRELMPVLGSLGLGLG